MAGEIARWFVTLGASDQGLKAALTTTKSELSGLRQAAAQTIPGLGMVDHAMRLGVAGAAVFLGAKLVGLTADLARTIYGLAETGAQAERLSTSFDILWASAGGGEATLAQLRDASRGTISDANLMLAANRAMMLGVSTSAGDLANLLEVAAFRGRALGLSTQQAFSDIVTGIGRMSPLILDNLGIVVDAEARFAEYAASIGKTSEALSAAEKRQVLFNSVLREGNAQMEAAGGLADDSATSFERAAAQVQNFKDQLSQLLALKIAPFIGNLSGAVGGFVELFTTDEKAMAQSASSYEDYVTRFVKAFGWYEQMRQQSIARMGFTIYPEKRLGFSPEDFKNLKFEAGMADLQATVEWGAGSPGKLLAPLKRTAAEIRDLLKFKATVDPESALKEARGAIDNAVSDLAAAVANGDISMVVAEELLQGIQMGAESYAQAANAGDLTPFQAAVEAARLNRGAQNWIDYYKGISDASEQAAEDVRDNMRSAIDQVLQPTFEGDPGNILDRLGLHVDTADEDARRLAAVMANGLHNEWVGYFKDKGLFKPEDLIDDKSVVAASARLLREFQLGLRPELIDKETAKQRVREILIGNQRMDQLVQEIMSELNLDGLNVSAATVRIALGDQTAAAGVAGSGAKAAYEAPLKTVRIIDPLADAVIADINTNGSRLLKHFADLGRASRDTFTYAFLSNWDFLNQMLTKLLGMQAEALEAIP